MPLTSPEFWTLGTVFWVVFVLTIATLWPWRNRRSVWGARADAENRVDREYAAPIPNFDFGAAQNDINAAQQAYALQERRRHNREADRRRYDLGAGQ